MRPSRTPSPLPADQDHDHDEANPIEQAESALEAAANPPPPATMEETLEMILSGLYLITRQLAVSDMRLLEARDSISQQGISERTRAQLFRTLSQIRSIHDNASQLAETVSSTLVQDTAQQPTPLQPSSTRQSPTSSHQSEDREDDRSWRRLRDSGRSDRSGGGDGPFFIG